MLANGRVTSIPSFCYHIVKARHGSVLQHRLVVFAVECSTEEYRGLYAILLSQVHERGRGFNAPVILTRVGEAAGLVAPGGRIEGYSVVAIHIRIVIVVEHHWLQHNIARTGFLVAAPNVAPWIATSAETSIVRTGIVVAMAYCHFPACPHSGVQDYLVRLLPYWTLDISSPLSALLDDAV